MKISIEIENIRCGGCTKTITKKLMPIEVINGVDVAVDVVDESLRNNVVIALTKMGYPELGSVEGVDALKNKAKSEVSCAIGKVSK
ncbi:MAG: copper chaperone [Cocleimonas sp.]